MALDNTDEPVTDDAVIVVSNAAMHLPESDRAGFVDKACAGNSKLLFEVLSRIEWEVKHHGFLLTPLLADEQTEQLFKPSDTILRRFRILRLAGEGGMGVVYEAEDDRLKRRIAIKFPRPQFRGRLTPEAFKALQVTHPNVCRVFELHTEDTVTGQIDFLTMELVEGETLAARLRREQQKNWLQTPEGMEIARQICAGLSAIHANSIVHRDLKPANIMLSRDTGAHIRAVIMDFGIAIGTDVFSSAARGTPAYVAPELWRGKPATVRSDIYALGVMLHEMSCGRKPFADDATWTERLETLPSVDGIRGPLRATVQRCLEPDPAQRFARVEDVVDSLFGRRWFLRAALGTAACGVLGAAGFRLKEYYAPTSTVRLTVLPPKIEEKIPASAQALVTGFANDLSYRLKILHVVRRPFSVFSVSQAAAGSVVTPSQSRKFLSSTHTITSELDLDGASWKFTVTLLNAARESVLRQWARTSNASGDALASELFALQSSVLQQTIDALTLRVEPPQQTLTGASYADYLQGLHFARADYENAAEAVPYFERVIAKAPNSALGYAGLAEALLQTQYATGDKSLEGKAVRALLKAEQLDPELSHVHLMAGRLNASNGRYENAIADCRRAAELDPRDSEAYVEMGYALALLGRYQEAEAAFQAAINAEPSYYKPYLDAGLFSYEIRDFGAAEKRWLEAVRLNPSHTRARLNLAYVYLRTDRLEQAHQQVQQSLALRRTRAALEFQGELFDRSHKYHDAIDYFEEAARTPPADYKTWASLAADYRRLERKEDALRALHRGLDEAVEGLPSNARDPERTAWCAYYAAALGQEHMARMRITETLAIADPPLGRIRKRLVLAYDALRDRASALRLLEAGPHDIAKEIAANEEGSSALLRDPDFQKLAR
jgi:serine/threonine protein kinase/tetratricopeptide (TPR) repeat protein